MLAHPSDCSILRGDDSKKKYMAGENSALLDGEGEVLAFFPPHINDSDIMNALRFANNSYKKGLEIGADRKAQEVRSCLGIQQHE